MFPSLDYLAFAGRWFGQVRYDLASSGLTPIAAEELGAARPDDLTARERFRVAVAARYGVTPAEVVPCLGGSGALFTAFATLIERGDRVVVESPGYEPTWRVPEALGAEVSCFTRGDTLDPDAVIDALPAGARAVVITNPHNPGAGIAPDATLARLAGRLLERGAWLFVDEAYLELARPAHTARGLARNIVAWSSSTKCWGVSWARAGWLLLPSEHAAAAESIERHVCGNAPPSSFAWGEVVFQNVDRLAARAAALQAGKRAIVDAFMHAHGSALEWTAPPETSLYGFVRDRRGRSVRPLVERAVSEHGVIVSPGEFFGEAAAFRLSWSNRSEVLQEGLERLARALDL